MFITVFCILAGQLQCNVPYHGHLTKFFTKCPPIRVCEFDQQSCLLAKFARLLVEHCCMVIDLTYLHVDVKIINIKFCWVPTVRHVAL